MTKVTINFWGYEFLTRSGHHYQSSFTSSKRLVLGIGPQDVTTVIILYYLIEIEVEFHGCVYLVSEDIRVGWMKILRDPCSSF